MLIFTLCISMVTVMYVLRAYAGMVVKWHLYAAGLNVQHNIVLAKDIDDYPRCVEGSPPPGLCLASLAGWLPAVSSSTSVCLCLYHFYRATLCVSAVFAVVRCLSVCPFVTLMCCIHTAWRYRQTSFSARYPRHSSFLDPSAVQGNLFSGGAKYMGLGFSTEIAVYLWCYEPLMVSQAADRCVSIRWPWVTPYPGFKVKLNI